MTFTWDEYRDKSKRGEVCAVVGCENKPSNMCTKCFVHYCYDHVRSHYHVVTDKEKEEDRTRNEKLR